MIGWSIILVKITVEIRQNKIATDIRQNKHTAEKDKIICTPTCFNAAIFARYGTSVGLRACPDPWRERNATEMLLMRQWQILMGADGYPHGWRRVSGRGIRGYRQWKNFFD